MQRALLVTLLTAVLPSLSSCWRARGAPDWLRVERTSPALGDPTAPILLNDALTVYFSAPILPLSVTSDSVSLRDEAGHQVPGALHAGANYVTFRPDPPLLPALDDGSFRPGQRYRLLLAGYPRPDAIRARDGRWLDAPVAFDVHVAAIGQQPSGLPAPLRPPATDLPFVLRPAALPLPLPADDPRLQLHFTLPVLPSTAHPEAFEILVLRSPIESLAPRRVRVMTSRVDDLPGSTVELDLGALPLRTAVGTPQTLRPGDWISVGLRPDSGLRDYSGAAPLPSPPLIWNVVAGDSLPLCEWPSSDDAYPADDGLLPGFEVRGATIRPRVRVETGNGSLGVFRPQVDTVLRPGEPFDPGDGRSVVSNGPEFPFVAIDVREGVTVTVDATAGPVRLLAVGGIRIAGDLVLRGEKVGVPPDRFLVAPVAELLAGAPVALLAAGDVTVTGRIAAPDTTGKAGAPLLLGSASGMVLRGELPFETILAVDASSEPRRAIEGARGQTRVHAANFTYGLSPGGELLFRAATSWRQLPADRGGGVLQVVDLRGDIELSWQSTPASSMQSDRPDLASGRMTRWQPVQSGEVLAAEPQAFVRLQLVARLGHGNDLPSIRALRLTGK